MHSSRNKCIYYKPFDFFRTWGGKNMLLKGMSVLSFYE